MLESIKHFIIFFFHAVYIIQPRDHFHIISWSTSDQQTDNTVGFLFQMMREN